MEELKNNITMARGKIKAEKVFKNAKIIDVFSNKIIEGDLALANGKIVGIGNYSGQVEVDLEGKFVCPTLIDAHVHIESSMMNPAQFAKAIIPNGVTTIIADPHEISNVVGLEGIRYLLKASEGLPLDVRMMLPSCVPATFFENSGANLTYEELAKLINEDRVHGIGEMMNYVGLLELDQRVLDKIYGFRDKIIDGHAPGLVGNDLNAYAYAGVLTDHECSTVEEMEDRISKGMYVLIRQGTAAKNADQLTKGVTKDNLSRCMFCTDDKHPEDLLKNGSINENIKIAIKNGIDPIDAIKMASINSAICYGLKKKGGLAPGYEGNFIVLEDLQEFKISAVYIAGEKYSENGEIIKDIFAKNHLDSLGSVNVYDYKLSDFEIKLSSNKANVIGIIPNSLVTEKLVEEVKVEDGKFVPTGDLLKLAVVERHRGLKSLGLGIIKGFGIKHGAMASTIAHDSHNIIILGDNDQDMFAAMKEIERINGGLVLVKDGKVLESLPLEIGGLMSNKSLKEIDCRISKILKSIKNDLGLDVDLDPIITLGFMALPVIPHIKLTDKGLFDVDKFEFIKNSI